jgi:hypothetical protein
MQVKVCRLLHLVNNTAVMQLVFMYNVHCCKRSSFSLYIVQIKVCRLLTLVNNTVLLTLSARPPFQHFSTPCILNVNNTGSKQGSIMK